VRILGATNQDIQTLITQGQFREDLLYRINTITLRVPPLRERQEDFAALAEHFLQTVRGAGLPNRSLSREAMAQLQSYRWPGNIRELRNVIERLVMMGSRNGAISGSEVKQVLPQTAGGVPEDNLTSCSLDEIERVHIQRVLEASGGNKTQAAKTLRIDYKTLLSKLKRYQLGG